MSVEAREGEVKGMLSGCQPLALCFTNLWNTFRVLIGVIINVYKYLKKQYKMYV